MAQDSSHVRPFSCSSRWETSLPAARMDRQEVGRDAVSILSSLDNIIKTTQLDFSNIIFLSPLSSTREGIQNVKYRNSNFPIHYFPIHHVCRITRLFKTEHLHHKNSLAVPVQQSFCNACETVTFEILQGLFSERDELSEHSSRSHLGGLLCGSHAQIQPWSSRSTYPSELGDLLNYSWSAELGSPHTAEHHSPCRYKHISVYLMLRLCLQPHTTAVSQTFCKVIWTAGHAEVWVCEFKRQWETRVQYYSVRASCLSPSKLPVTQPDTREGCGLLLSWGRFLEKHVFPPLDRLTHCCHGCGIRFTSCTSGTTSSIRDVNIGHCCSRIPKSFQ